MAPTEYRRPPSRPDALRLHLNENTAGCSPYVLEALRRLDALDVAQYPDYGAATRQVADHLGIGSEWLLLINGLDEGILAAAVASLRADRPVSIVCQPSFDMYEIATLAVGGRVTSIPADDNFQFPLAAIVDSIGPHTGLVFVNNPHNPTGLTISRDSIATIARAAEPHAKLFVDEAYVDFSGDSFLPSLQDHRNVIIGRTFAKAHGLAGLRVGCVVANPDTLQPLRAVVPPYSLNVCAMVGLQAALEDSTFVRSYVDEVAQAKALIYETCRRLDLFYWPSAANFVLVRIGSGATHLALELERRGILVRDRSTPSDCPGCVRLTVGTVQQTGRLMSAIEEVLCAGR